MNPWGVRIILDGTFNIDIVLQFWLDLNWVRKARNKPEVREFTSFSNIYSKFSDEALGRSHTTFQCPVGGQGTVLQMAVMQHLWIAPPENLTEEELTDDLRGALLFLILFSFQPFVINGVCFQTIEVVLILVLA